jgi:tryptophanyl-tRNA synthetase
MRERAAQFENDPGLVQSILLEGAEKARDVARETLEDVRAAIGLSHK